MKRWFYAYVLFSRKDSQFYSGFTEDLKGRFEQHSKGQVASTRERRPLDIVYSEACLCKRDALHRERYFKTYMVRCSYEIGSNLI